MIRHELLTSLSLGAGDLLDLRFLRSGLVSDLLPPPANTRNEKYAAKVFFGCFVANIRAEEDENLSSTFIWCAS